MKEIRFSYIRSAGSVLTETAIVLPILLALSVAVLEFSHIYFAKSELQAALDVGLEYATVVDGLEYASDDGSGGHLNDPAKEKIYERLLKRASTYFANGTDLPAGKFPSLIAKYPKRTTGRRITSITLDIGEDGSRTNLSRYLQENPIRLEIEAEIPSLFGLRPEHFITFRGISNPHLALRANSAAFRESAIGNAISRLFDCKGQPLTPEDIAAGNFPSVNDCGCADDPNDPTRVSIGGVCQCRIKFVLDDNKNGIPDGPNDPDIAADIASGVANTLVESGECICDPGPNRQFQNGSGEGQCICVPCEQQVPPFVGGVIVNQNTCSCGCPDGAPPITNALGLPQCACVDNADHPFACGCKPGQDEVAFNQEVCVPHSNETGLLYFDDPDDGICNCIPGCSQPSPWIANPSDLTECICDQSAIDAMNSSMACTSGNPDSMMVAVNDPQEEICGCLCPADAETTCLGQGENFVFFPSKQGQECLCEECPGNKIRNPSDPTQCICPDSNCTDGNTTDYYCATADDLCGCRSCPTEAASGGAENPNYWIRDSSSATQCTFQANCVCDVQRLYDEVCRQQGKVVFPDTCECVGCASDNTQGGFDNPTAGGDPTQCTCTLPECTGDTYLCGSLCECKPCSGEFQKPILSTQNDSAAGCNQRDRCYCDAAAKAAADCAPNEYVDPEACECLPCPAHQYRNPGDPTACECTEEADWLLPANNPDGRRYFCRATCSGLQCPSTPAPGKIAKNTISCQTTNQNCKCDTVALNAMCTGNTYPDPASCSCVACETWEQVNGSNNGCECLSIPNCSGLGTRVNYDTCQCDCEPGLQDVGCPTDVNSSLCCAIPCPPSQTCQWLPGGSYGSPE